MYSRMRCGSRESVDVSAPYDRVAGLVGCSSAMAEWLCWGTRTCTMSNARSQSQSEALRKHQLCQKKVHVQFNPSILFRQWDMLRQATDFTTINAHHFINNSKRIFKINTHLRFDPKLRNRLWPIKWAISLKYDWTEQKLTKLRVMWLQNFTGPGASDDADQKYQCWCQWYRYCRHQH